jgi:hypothetical protein
LAEALDSDQPTSSKSRRLRAPATTVLVEPRPKRPGAFFVGERQNPGQLALLGHEPDRLDHRSQHLGGFRTQLFLVPRLRQLRDLPLLDLGEAGVQHWRFLDLVRVNSTSPALRSWSAPISPFIPGANSPALAASTMLRIAFRPWQVWH